MSAPGVVDSAVEVELLYLSPNSILNRRFVAPSIDVTAGQFEPHRVVIRNGRAFSEPPQDWPLAVCDGRSVAPDEGTPNVMAVVDALPNRETMYRPLPGEERKPATSVFHFNPNIGGGISPI